MIRMLKRSGIHVFYFLFIFIWMLLNSCQNGGQKNSDGSFYMNDNSAFFSIVSFYDSIVSAKSPGIVEIDKAYFHYLDSVCPLILQNGDFSHSGINAEERKKLFDKLPEDDVAEVFYVGDTVEYFSMDIKRKVKKYFPYHVTINTEGQFASLLKSLSDSNQLLNKYYNSMIESGDISPTCYGLILRDYNKLDFSNPDHRLIFTVTILSVNPSIKDRFVH